MLLVSYEVTIDIIEEVMPSWAAIASEKGGNRRLFILYQSRFATQLILSSTFSSFALSEPLI